MCELKSGPPIIFLLWQMYSMGWNANLAPCIRQIMPFFVFYGVTIQPDEYRAMKRNSQSKGQLHSYDMGVDRL